MSRGDNMALKHKANAFLIWRAGTAVDWDCTVRDLAEETGLARSTVGNICRRRGWPVESGSTDNREEKWAVDRHFAK